VVFVLEIVWEKPPSECAGEIDLVLRNSPPTSHATPQPSAWIPRESSTNDDIAGPTDSAMVWRLRLTTPRNRHIFLPFRCATPGWAGDKWPENRRSRLFGVSDVVGAIEVACDPSSGLDFLPFRPFLRA